MYEKNGIMYLEMRQPDYLDTTIKQFKSQIDKEKFTRKDGIVECPCLRILFYLSLVIQRKKSSPLLRRSIQI